MLICTFMHQSTILLWIELYSPTAKWNDSSMPACMPHSILSNIDQSAPRDWSPLPVDMYRIMVVSIRKFNNYKLVLARSWQRYNNVLEMSHPILFLHHLLNPALFYYNNLLYYKFIDDFNFDILLSMFVN